MCLIIAKFDEYYDVMSDKNLIEERIFGPDDYREWLDRVAREAFGVGAEEFADAYRRGEFADHPVAHDMACVIPFMRKKIIVQSHG